MIKRSTLLLAALAVLLVAVPAFANASTGLTTTKGTLLSVGTEFTINGTGQEQINAIGLGGQSYCEPPLFFNGRVLKNSPSEGVEASGSVRAWGGCMRGNRKERSQIELPTLKSSPTEPGKGKANIGFTVEIATGVFCHWSSKEAPFTYTSESDLINFTNVSLTGAPAACGNAKWSAQYALMTKEGAPLLLM
jgi:hypothetical protein